MFTFGWDGKAIIWNTATKTETFSHDNDNIRFHIACMAPDNKLVAAGDYKGVLHFFDI